MNTRHPSELETLEFDNLLHSDVGSNILLELEIRDSYALSLTNRRLFQLFGAKVWLRELAYYLVIEPNEKKVEGILNRDLKILNTELKEIVLQTKTLKNMTPLQLAQSAGDIEMRNNVFKPLFIKFYGDENKGLEEMDKQIGELKNIHKSFDFGPIMQAISNETFNLGLDTTGRLLLNPATLIAIQIFTKEYDENQPTVIDKAMQFRWETLKEFSMARDIAHAQWPNAKEKYYRLSLIKNVVLRKVIQHATENDKTRFNQGFINLKQGIFERRHKNTLGQTFDDSCKVPAFDFCLDFSCPDILYGEGTLSSFSDRGIAQLEKSELQSFYDSKIANLQNLCRQHQEIRLGR
jgi:hypothetical protein